MITPKRTDTLKLMPFDGLRVVSFESRRAAEMAELIRRQGGDPFVAPSMRESPIENNSEAFDFAERLFRGEFDLVIFLTGVGTRALNKVLASRYPEAAIRRSIAQNHRRRPRPQAHGRTARDEGSRGRHRARAQHLARASGRARRPAANETSRSRNTANRIRNFWTHCARAGAKVTPVRVYQWDLPEDTAPLREAVRRIAGGQADVAMFTTSIQIPHLFRIAAEEELDRRVAARPALAW